jgi:hypothetical protein
MNARDIHRDRAKAIIDLVLNHTATRCVNEDLIREVQAAIRAAEDAVREEDIKAVCPECTRGVFPEVQDQGGGAWVHMREDVGYWVCHASPIRALNKSETKP